jgi:hypothetical protein
MRHVAHLFSLLLVLVGALPVRAAEPAQTPDEFVQQQKQVAIKKIEAEIERLQKLLASQRGNREESERIQKLILKAGAELSSITGDDPPFVPDLKVEELGVGQVGRFPPRPTRLFVIVRKIISPDEMVVGIGTKELVLRGEETKGLGDGDRVFLDKIYLAKETKEHDAKILLVIELTEFPLKTSHKSPSSPAESAPRTNESSRAGDTPRNPKDTPTTLPGSNGTVQVRGYYRKDGTYVAPYTRSMPGSGGKKK